MRLKAYTFGGNVMNLGLSAVIQDVGMNYISGDVLNKTTPLTPGEMDKIYQHPLYSRDIIEKSNTVPSHIADIAMQGHERINGSGYPMGLQEDRIDHMGKVLAVASVYTALISPRPYRPALDPYRAMFTLLHYSQHRLLDREITRKLVETLSLFPVGSLVRLKSGAVAKVVSANEQAYTQPTVRILLDAQGQMLERPRLVNLEKDEEKIAHAVEAEKYPELGGMVGF